MTKKKSTKHQKTKRQTSKKKIHRKPKTEECCQCVSEKFRTDGDVKC